MSGGGKTQFGSLLAMLNGGASAGTSEAPNVQGSDTGAMRSAFSNNMISDQMFWADYPRGDMSLAGAKEFEAPMIMRMMTIWTLFDDTTPFTSIMPVIESDQTNLMIQRRVYLPTVTKRTAERTRSHTVEHRNKSLQAVMERLSVAIELGYPMLQTQYGREVYAQGLVQMRNATIESNAVNMLNELQTSPGHYRDPGRRYAHLMNANGKTMHDIIELERQFFMVFQKPDTAGRAFQLIDALVRKIQAPQRGRGNTYIMPRHILSYNALIPDQNTLFLYGGQQAVDRFNAGPNAIFSDGMGNSIVTFTAYQIEEEAPFNPFTRYIAYSEFNEFGKEMSNVKPSEWCLDAMSCQIYDIDQDDWVTITPSFVVENCGRFNSATGELLYINSPEIQRHEVAYDEDQKNDSFHYVVNLNGRPELLPIREIGLFSKNHLSTARRRKAVAIALNRMKTLATEGFEKPEVTAAIKGGRDLLAAIEAVPLDGNARAFMDAAVAGKTVLDATSRSNTSAFSPLGVAVYEQNEHSGWPLPKLNKAAWGITAPVGYGSAAGILNIAAAYVDSGMNDLEFARVYGFSGDIGRRAHAFANVLNQFASDVKTLFEKSQAVDAGHVSPWWLRGSTVHALWDNVIAPQYRVPIYHAVGAVAPAATASGAGALSPAAAARVKEVEDFIQAEFTGALATFGALRARAMGVAAPAPRPRQGAQTPSLIQAGLGAGGDERVAVDPQQPGQAAFTDLTSQAKFDSFLQTLPELAAATFVLGDVKSIAGNAAPPLAIHVEPSDVLGVSADELIWQAYDVLAAAIMNTTTSNQSARAALLFVLSAVKKGANAAESARNILKLYDEVVAPYVARDALVSSDGNDAGLLRRIAGDVKGFIDAFQRWVVNGANVAFHDFGNDLIRAQRAVASLRNTIAPAAAASSVLSAAGYALTPLVYSPTQLLAAGANAAGDYAFSHPENPAAIISPADYASYERSLNALRSGAVDTNSLPHALHPVSISGDSASPITSTALFNNLKASGKGPSSAAIEDLAGTRNTGRTSGAADSDMAEAQLALARSSGRKRDQAAFFSKETTAFSRGRDAGLAAARQQEEADRAGRAKRSRPVNIIDSNLANRLTHDTFVENWDEVDSDRRSFVEMWLHKVLLLTHFNLHQLRVWIEKEMDPLLRALLLRVMVLGMESIIKVAKGEIGNQYFGNAMYTWTLDGQSRIFTGLWSYYYKAFITTFENVFHIDNVYSNNYLGGFSTMAVGLDDGQPIVMADDINPARRSVYVALEPPSQDRPYEPHISWTGRLSDPAKKLGATVHPTKRLDFTNAYAFNAMYGSLEQHIHEVNSGSVDSAGYEPGHAPLLAFQGATKYYSAVTRQFSVQGEAQGYLPTVMFNRGLKALLNGALQPAPGAQHMAVVKS